MQKRLCGPSCDQVKRIFGIEFSCAKNNRFCEKHQIRLLELWPEAQLKNLSINDFKIASKKILANATDIEIMILHDELIWPTTAAEFINITQQLNQYLFKEINTTLERLGRFRIAGEEVDIDIGKHKFHGEEPEKS